MLPVPVDAAIARAGQLLQKANGEPWAEAGILAPRSLLYAYAGRFSDAREAMARAQAVYCRSEAKFTQALVTAISAEIELIAGDPATAERHLREAYQAFHAMRERGFLSSLAGRLAEALYAQGRLDEAQQLTEEAQAATVPGDIDAQARWQATRAKLLARSGQFPAAHTGGGATPTGSRASSQPSRSHLVLVVARVIVGVGASCVGGLLAWRSHCPRADVARVAPRPLRRWGGTLRSPEGVAVTCATPCRARA